MFYSVRDWSLVTGRGGGEGYKTGGGWGASEVLTLKKKGGGAEKVLAITDGGSFNRGSFNRGA